MAYLEIETHDRTRRVRLERERLRIGRLSNNDVVLPFAQVSRQHAELRRINGQWWITDLNSTNGLQIDSRRIQEHALNSGDRVVLAPGIALVFMAEGAPDESAPLQTPPPTSSVSAQRPFRRDAQAEGGFGQLLPSLELLDDGAGYSSSSPSAFANDSPLEPGPASDAWAGSSESYPRSPSLFGANGASGRHLPARPLAGSGDDDHYRRESAASEHARVTAGPVAMLLHVCQTCGQLTAPDAVYCQSCHNSIAHECSRCYFSLLPIHERCPRCHTPNVMSVRRAHLGRGGA
jgi:pSer/pThr/pTyr-binding forkhead associated (FHA) protein